MENREFIYVLRKRRKDGDVKDVLLLMGSIDRLFGTTILYKRISSSR